MGATLCSDVSWTLSTMNLLDFLRLCLEPFFFFFPWANLSKWEDFLGPTFISLENVTKYFMDMLLICSLPWGCDLLLFHFISCNLVMRNCYNFLPLQCKYFYNNSFTNNIFSQTCKVFSESSLSWHHVKCTW